jgi:serine/threonine protein phosphatase PrpC
VSRSLEAVGVLKAAADTHPGLYREVNEDRFHLDVSRGLLMVIDGVGGQAAGGKAADTAVRMLRARLERETGTVGSRLREAIASANNEIHRLAGLRPEWNGMACVLTAVVINDSRAVVGHVGDTRLYKLRHGLIEKITFDHSPVGEREDARELSELDAMQHPRRNEVYRDVGSEPHEPGDPDFIDVYDMTFEPDAAVLLCSDGLTDLVDSSSVNEIVARFAGRPQEVVKALIDAANAAGGKDNVTVVYAEGERFAPPTIEALASANEITRRLGSLDGAPAKRHSAVRLANILLIAVLILLTFVRSDTVSPPDTAPDGRPPVSENTRIVVQANQSIAEALAQAPAGATIVVEPHEYRERLTLRDHVRLVSRVPRGAVIRLPGASSEGAAAIVARDVTGAVLDGFRIVGDAATPLGTGIVVERADLSIIDVEISGAANAAIDARKDSRVRIVGADVRDNPGSALAVRGGGLASISHSAFARNATTGRGRPILLLEERGTAQFSSNVFVGDGPAVFTGSSDARAAFARSNVFDNRSAPASSRPRPRGR